MSPLWLLLMALAIGTLSGVVSSVISSEVIKKNAIAKYRRETLADRGDDE